MLVKGAPAVLTMHYISMCCNNKCKYIFRFVYQWLSLIRIYMIAGRAFVVAKEVFVMETVVFWQCDNG